ncbi:hypothetical protein V6N13_093742 [Hibiscus sabdariffa]|uniref:Uncharacterized protein n=1 Tax=Hibiscus sabdariffa TaxID=183260 RepID=A0ABR2BSL4_9ROSI
MTQPGGHSHLPQYQTFASLSVQPPTSLLIKTRNHWHLFYQRKRFPGAASPLLFLIQFCLVVYGRKLVFDEEFDGSVMAKAFEANSGAEGKALYHMEMYHVAPLLE